MEQEVYGQVVPAIAFWDVDVIPGIKTRSILGNDMNAPQSYWQTLRFAILSATRLTKATTILLDLESTISKYVNEGLNVDWTNWEYGISFLPHGLTYILYPAGHSDKPEKLERQLDVSRAFARSLPNVRYMSWRDMSPADERSATSGRAEAELRKLADGNPLYYQMAVYDDGEYWSNESGALLVDAKIQAPDVAVIYPSKKNWINGSKYISRMLARLRQPKG